MIMSVAEAAKLVERAVVARKRVAVIDSRWRIVAGLWSLIPPASVAPCQRKFQLIISHDPTSFRLCKKIAMASDHAGYELKCIIENHLTLNGRGYVDFGTDSEDSCDYPDFAHPCAEAVESGECYPGIAMCGSGNGISMTLNKHQGIRAALCWTPELARPARAHNDANILVLPARFIEPGRL